jgi:hypothetical protein
MRIADSGNIYGAIGPNHLPLRAKMDQASDPDANRHFK